MCSKQWPSSQRGKMLSRAILGTHNFQTAVLHCTASAKNTHQKSLQDRNSTCIPQMSVDLFCGPNNWSRQQRTDRWIFETQHWDQMVPTNRLQETGSHTVTCFSVQQKMWQKLARSAVVLICAIPMRPKKEKQAPAWPTGKNSLSKHSLSLLHPPPTTKPGFLHHVSQDPRN